jgi:endo-1,4-beta-mannosidase
MWMLATLGRFLDYISIRSSGDRTVSRNNGITRMIDFARSSVVFTGVRLRQARWQRVAARRDSSERVMPVWFGGRSSTGQRNEFSEPGKAHQLWCLFQVTLVQSSMNTTEWVHVDRRLETQKEFLRGAININKFLDLTDVLCMLL